MAKQKKTVDFEQSLAQLQSVVEQLEKGELSLEESLKQFEQGIVLTRDCQTALNHAEQTVKQLLERDGQALTVPFETDADA